MIISSRREKYDGSWRIILYETDAAGQSTPHLTKSSFDEDIDSFYEQRQRDLERLEARLFAGEISPLCFFMELTHMTVEDAAARMKLRKSVVRDHMTPAGFEHASIGTLKGYAKLFDLSLADFFQFTRLEGEFSVTVRHSQDRLVQEICIAPKGVPAA